MDKLSPTEERAWCKRIHNLYHIAHTALGVARAEERDFHEYMNTWHRAKDEKVPGDLG